jgi:hypothetical protein
MEGSGRFSGLKIFSRKKAQENAKGGEGGLPHRVKVIPNPLDSMFICVYLRFGSQSAFLRPLFRLFAAGSIHGVIR